MQRPSMGTTLLATALAFGVMGSDLGGPASNARAQALVPVTTPRTAQPSSALSEAKARSAAERILQALRSGDANVRYAQFAPRLQRMTSPTLVAAHMSKQPKVLGWTINSVEPGVESSTVEATLTTSAGPRQLLMVIDDEGQLDGYHFEVGDQPAEKVTRDFIEAIIQGRYVYANSFLSSELQAEISAAGLQRKWQNLQRLTGDFVKLRQISRSEGTADMKLVLVTTQFNRLTDNLYVILDSRNTIIGVDFPTEPAAPAPAR
jgi:hypothetical protein